MRHQSTYHLLWLHDNRANFVTKMHDNQHGKLCLINDTDLTFALVGGGHFGPPPPLWFFEDNSKTKRSSVTKLGIPFH